MLFYVSYDAPMELRFDSTVQYCFVADFDFGEDDGVSDLHVLAYFNVFSYDCEWSNFGFFANSKVMKLDSEELKSPFNKKEVLQIQKR